MKKNIIAIVVFFSLLTLQCSKTDTDHRKLTLKESIEESVTQINSAAVKMSASKGFQLLSVTEDAAKADFGFKDSINLDLVAGIYDYKPDTVSRVHFYYPYRLFRKTGTSDRLIVNLPEKLVYHPRQLHLHNQSNSRLNNNFRITASDYHFYYNWWNKFDYKLIAGFTLDAEDIGELSIYTAVNPHAGSIFSTAYSFPEGYSITKMGQTGDTTKISFALLQDEDTLLMETVIFFGEGFKRKEKQYILSIGNVDIKRGNRIDSIQVYLDGILQEKAGAKIIDTLDYNASICYKRDILLMFDDGTTARLSELISPARATLKKLVRSLGEMYLSKQIVDYIAFSIYYNNH